jgi:hypothetical protein
MSPTAPLDECLFVAEGDGFQPTEWAVGPWSADTLQAATG